MKCSCGQEDKMDRELLSAIGELLEKTLEEKLEVILEEKLEAILEDKLERMLDEKLDRKLNEKLSPIYDRLTRIEITLENEIRPNIMRVAEGHLDLSRKLDAALKSDAKREMLEIKVNYLDGEVRKLQMATA